MGQATPHQSSRQVATQWLVKLQSPHLSEEQQQDFFVWLDESPEHQQAYIEAETLWDSLGVVEQLAQGTESAPEIKAVARPWYLYPQAISACVLGLVALLLVQLWPMGETGQYQTAVGEQRQVALSDGSNIHLNTDSQLTIELLDNSRLVTMKQGEAFFTVSRDPNRPFIIKTPNGLVRVLGTRFNVRTTTSKTVVTVEQGKVGLTQSAAQEEISAIDYQPQQTLSANQQATLTRSSLSAKPAQVDSATLSSWRQGKQVYNDQTFADVVEDLNRYFDGEIILGDTSLAKIRLVAVLDLKDKNSAIAALESTLNVVAINESEKKTVLYPAK